MPPCLIPMAWRDCKLFINIVVCGRRRRCTDTLSPDYICRWFIFDCGHILWIRLVWYDTFLWYRPWLTLGLQLFRLGSSLRHALAYISWAIKTCHTRGKAWWYSVGLWTKKSRVRIPGSAKTVIALFVNIYHHWNYVLCYVCVRLLFRFVLINF